MRTVLVADRDQATRLLVGTLLSDKGFGVVMASSASRASTVLEDNPEIVGLVTDASLCTPDGKALLAELRADERYRQLPIIAIGSDATVNEVMTCLQRGASRFVAKRALTIGLPEEIDAVLAE